MNLRHVSSLTVVRALAIILVVINHAYPQRLHGGMNVLMVVSGIAMAQFAFNASTRDTLSTFARFGRRLLIPSLLVALMSAFLKEEFSWPEILMFSNWLTSFRISLFPIWYTQCMLQMLVVFAGVFALTNLTERIRSHPRGMTLALFSIAIATAAITIEISRRTPGPDLQGLPMLHAWHFLFGWVIWAFLRSPGPAMASRMVLSVIHVATSALIFLVLDADMGDRRFLAMLVLLLPMFWLDTVPLPRWIAQALSLVSQATFTIFLLHYSFFNLALEVAQNIGGEQVERIDPNLRLLAGIAGPTGCWILWRATTRVWRRHRIDEPALQRGTA